MDEALRAGRMSADQEQEFSAVFRRERGRLRNFIRKRVANEGDAEDILQEVFSELVESYGLMRPVEQVGAWLFRVARNRITDLFRKTKTEPRGVEAANPDEEDGLGGLGGLEELLPSPTMGPEAAYTRSVLLDELEAALEELPATQREVFVAHALEGRSFKELAAETGVSVNTLLSRKHYAVVFLRQRLQAIYDDYFLE
jgi:RNA polymerase sigma factor (sigma-70 family)